MAPEKIGRYQVQSSLGRGGMATVYAAYDPSFERSIAIKVLPPEFLHDPQFRTRFQREAKAIAALEHPGIVPVYDFGEEDGQPYLVMRLMSGGSLKDRIAEGPLSLEEATTIVERIGAALGAAHNKGVIHRDLKPGNILFDGDGNPFIADFGIVKLTEHTSQLTGSGMVGTPAYMAPELATIGGITPLIDIYAMGVTLYQMLAGELPFNAETPMGLLAAHVTQPVPDVRDKRPDLPEEIQFVIERAMAKDPAERYQTMGELVDDLQGLAMTSEGVTTQTAPRITKSAMARRTQKARPAPVIARKTPAAQRTGVSPVWIIGGMAVTLALVVGLLFALGILPPRQQVADLTTEAPSSPSASQETPVEISPTAASLIPTIQTVGAVDILVPGGGVFEAATGSRPLDTGDEIRVGEGGIALLTLAAGVSAELHPGTQIRLDRLAEADNTLFVEMTQTTGTAYHYISPDPGGLARDYVVHTPRGTAHATGTRFWTGEQSEDWLYAPADGSIVLEVGADDDNPADNYTAEAANEDCLLVDAAENVTNCDFEATDLTPLTDGQNIASSLTPTPTVKVVAAPPPTLAPADQPTSTAQTTSTPVPPGPSGPVCGNGSCEGGENSSNCPSDCAPPPPTCPNGTCGAGETCSNCPQDCGSCPPVCGNGSCESGETSSNCPQDCGAVCGDGSCNGSETKCSCASDCGAPSCNGTVSGSQSGSCDTPPFEPNWVCTQVDECGQVCKSWTQCSYADPCK